MATGVVKWFNPTKSYGFIQPDQGGSDVFVHISALERDGLATLNEGQKVSYELATNKGKTSAANLKGVRALPRISAKRVACCASSIAVSTHRDSNR